MAQYLRTADLQGLTLRAEQQRTLGEVLTAQLWQGVGLGWGAAIRIVFSVNGALQYVLCSA